MFTRMICTMVVGAAVAVASSAEPTGKGADKPAQALNPENETGPAPAMVLAQATGTGPERPQNPADETSRAGTTPSRYAMRQKPVSFGDDFWIRNESGEPTFKVNGKLLRVRRTLDFEDAQGNVGAQIQERMLRVKDSMANEGPGGVKLAEVKKALITPLRDRWVVKIGNGPSLKVQGDVLAHEYTIGEGDQRIAEVSKKWFRFADSYGVGIAPGQNDILILAVTVAIDAMVHPGK